METPIHSNSVQEIISRPPSSLIKCGTYLIIASIGLMIMSTFLVPYPHVLEQRIILNAISDCNNVVVVDSIQLSGHFSVPSSQYGQIKQGQSVCIRLLAYPYLEYGTLDGYVSSISNDPQIISGALYYEVGITIPNKLLTSKGIYLPYATKLEGIAEIETERQMLSEILFPFVTNMSIHSVH